MTVYLARTGIDYRSSETGEYVRVEEGGKISDMDDVAVQHELEAGNIILHTEKKGGKKE